MAVAIVRDGTAQSPKTNFSQKEKLCAGLTVTPPQRIINYIHDKVLL